MNAQDEPDCISERELIELFEPRRAQPEPFREGVDRRIEKLRADNEKLQAAPAPSRLRRAASMLPVDVILGAAGGSAAGKLAAAKLVPAALALPVLLLGSALGAFAAGSRSLQRSASSAAPIEPDRQWSLEGPQHNRDLRIGPFLQRMLGFFVLVSVLVVPWFGGTDMVLVVLVISMAALAISIRGFASAGLMARPQVTRLCANVLYCAFVGSFLVGHYGTDASSEFGIGWSAALVLGGSTWCFLVSPRTAKDNLKILAVGGLLLVLNPIGCTRSSPASLRDQLESMVLAPGELDTWDEAVALDRALRMIGGPAPDFTAVQQRIHASIETGDDRHWADWLGALELGLIDAEHRATLRKSFSKEIEGVRSGSAPLNYMPFDQALVALLRDETNSDPELRERLADQLESNWPKPGEHGALEDAWLCVRGLDDIGARARADGLRKKAHGLLVEHWVVEPKLFGRRGGFTSNPAQLQTSFDDDTWCAVLLMERFGAPEEIDLRLLRGHLRNQSRVMLMDTDVWLHAESRASLRVLEDCIGMPERSAFQRVFDERLLIVSLLLVALCLTAIRLAPSPESHEQPGALP